MGTFKSLSRHARNGSHLSTVATSEQNEDSSWGDGGAQLSLVLAEGLLPVALEFTRNILCGVVAGLRWGGHRNIILILGLLQKFSERHAQTKTKVHSFAIESNDSISITLN